MYKYSKNKWIKHFDFIILDVICIQFALFVAGKICYGNYSEIPVIAFRDLGVFLLCISLSCGLLTKNYAGVIRRDHFEELKATILYGISIAFFWLLVMFCINKIEHLSRGMFVLTVGFGFLFVYISRCVRKRCIRKRIDRSIHRRTITIVTTLEVVNEVLENIKTDSYQAYEVTGIILMDLESNVSKIQGIPVVAQAYNALEYLKGHVVDEVFFNIPKGMDLPESLVKACKKMGITVHINVLHYINWGKNTKIDRIGDYTVMTSSIKLVSMEELILKRLIDLAGGIVGVFITGIVTLFVAPIIYIQSPGPIFFTQKRVGLNGRIFHIYKFRSMYTDAEERKKELMEQNEMQGLMFKMKDDPRIFPFGKFIRKWSIDELPQLFNVLKGEMSLVGTRPPTVDEYNQYEHWHKKRLATKPGLTGMWQVSGRSDITDFEEVVALDTKYIEEWTVGMDLKILIKTVGVVLGKKGSV